LVKVYSGHARFATAVVRLRADFFEFGGDGYFPCVKIIVANTPKAS
jgi:hypothetical protein